jgi:hypothetical protein
MYRIIVNSGLKGDLLRAVIQKAIQNLFRVQAIDILKD